MKFHVTLRPRIHPYEFDDPVGLIKATQSYFEDALAKGLIELAYGYLDNGGFMIIEADTTEALWDVIHMNPINWAFDHEIEPLIEMGHSFKRFFELSAQRDT
jgi:hypothetical protein